MIVVIEEKGTEGTARVRAALGGLGVKEIVAFRVGGCGVLLTEEGSHDLADRVRALPSVARVLFPLSGSPLARRENFADSTIVDVGLVSVGAEPFVVMAGPCAVEDREHLRTSAVAVRDAGAAILRGGAHKPRTSPYAFQGTGAEGVALLTEVGCETGLPVVSEVMDPRDLDHMVPHVDMLQIGTRNAQNFRLLDEVGRAGVPVLLKRGFGCTVDEWLGAAEYILRQGNSNVVLCERGIRTFESATRFTLDLAAVSVVKRRSHLPVVVDPSHGAGNRDLVLPMAL
ncbi:MAG TPA: 3-deoxy-7-phosphoheptulonate synthase, partial [Micromonosporaceae bacterium]|nr:3-deoxy-7-phosphoheptulonate synthase [Micromonosporaceae bacterium]